MKAKSPHLIGLRSEATARQALTLSPPIRMGAEREQQAGNIRIRRLAGHRQVQGFNARIASGNSLPVWRGEGEEAVSVRIVRL